MSNQSQSSVSNGPLFETFFSKNKKLFLILPVVLILLLVGLFLNSSQTNTQIDEKNNVDLALPTAETKDLSDNKIDAMNDFNELNTAKEKEDQKGDGLDIDNFNPDSQTNSNSIYEKPNDDEVVNKVNSMMKEMNRKKPSSSTRQTNYNSSRVASPSVEPNYTGTTDNNPRDSFDDFFSSNKTEGSKSASSQEDNITYAVIKGDQLGIRNNQRVSLILTKETIINNKIFKKNTIFYAIASFTSNRVVLNVSSINQIPVSIKAYDAEDGGLGLQVKQSLMAESSKEIVSDGTDEVDVSGVPLGNTIKKLFKRKQQDIKVDLLNNQRLIIKF